MKMKSINTPLIKRSVQPFLYPLHVVGDTSKHREIICFTVVVSPADYTSQNPLASSFCTNKRSSAISLKQSKIVSLLFKTKKSNA